MRKRWATIVALSLAACGKDKSQWVQERQKSTELARTSQKQDQEKKEQAAASPVETAPAPKDPFWDDSALIHVDNDRSCPDGLWSLFPGKAPGEGAERKRNEAQRRSLAKQLRGSRFLTTLRPPNEVKLESYDAAKGQFPLTVSGMVDCQDAAGHLGVAFNDATAINPGNSAAKAGAEVQLNVWQATPFTFFLPMKSMSEAKAFGEHHRFDLEARVVFRLGATQVDHKMFKTTRRSEANVSIGGGNEDWGAGRLVRAQVEAVRVTADRGRASLVDTRR